MTVRRRAALAAVIALACCAAFAGVASAAIDGVDLSTYHRTERLDLPVGTGVDLQASEASGVAYDPTAGGSLYIVGDEGTAIAHVGLDGTLIDTMTLSGFEDTEGIASLGGGRLAITEERLRQVDRVTYVPNTTITHADVDTVKLGTTIDNIGLEGVSNDASVADGLVLVKEKDPESIFTTTVDWAAGAADNGSPTADAATDLFTPSSAGLSDFSDVFALDNLPSLSGKADATRLLMISQESGKIITIGRDGSVGSSLTIRRDADNPLTVQDQTMEGITMDDDGTLYVVNEQGGGTDQPQLWVYKPTATPNAAPTAVSLTPATTSLPETASTAGWRKLADVTVTDADGLGVNDLSVTGPDAADFEVDDSGLYLKAGVALDYEAKSSYAVSVAADDTTVGATPDATSDPFTLTITNVAEGPGAADGIRISEIAPWGSGDSGVGADWWELTNTGTEPVDLTGFKMDDSSAAFGSAVALTGVGVLQPGRSAIFLEGDASKVTAFVSFWFGGTLPAGVQVGSYSGSGVGLSTGGDAVVVFDADGNPVTGVKFGDLGTNSSVTLDNSAGAGTKVAPFPMVDTATSETQAGADLAGAPGAEELGSPGALDWPLRITEVDPSGSGNDTYKADWFEVTNVGTVNVPLSGFRMDDSSPTFASAAPLADVDAVAPGASVVFVEGNAAKETAFRAAWHGDDAPPLKVGSYSGSGVGLSTGGDEVNLYDSVGHHITGVKLGAATDGVSFDNHAALGSPIVPLPDADATVATLSARGAFGAYVAGAETGSPGTIAPDVTKPVVTVGAHSDTYNLDARVQVTCTAADEARGSGVDPGQTDCADVDNAASEYGPGAHTLTFTATDHAGNATTATVTFTVAAPADGGDDGGDDDSGEDDGTTTTPTETIPTPPTPPTSPQQPNPPVVPISTPTPAQPGLSRPTSAKAASLAKGVSTKLTHLKAKSKVTLKVRYAGKTLATITGKANGAGTATLKVKLSKARLAKLKGKKLTLRYTVTGADGKAKTLSTTLEVSG
jgi:uncharacterized protein YjiK